jgi:hypothetical protein
MKRNLHDVQGMKCISHLDTEPGVHEPRAASAHEGAEGIGEEMRGATAEGVAAAGKT